MKKIIVSSLLAVALVGCTTSTTPNAGGGTTTTSTINTNDIAIIQSVIATGVTDAAVIAQTVNNIKTGQTNK
jgi:hypothetical protein